jgi:hypothetical protein
MTLAPGRCGGRMPTIVVPPVAIRSSINTTRSPCRTVSACISTAVEPQSSAQRSCSVVKDSLPILRISTRPTFSS